MAGGFILNVKRARTPFYRFLKRAARGILHASLPVPRWLRPAFRALYDLHSLLTGFLRWAWNFFYTQPLFRGRCAEVGRGLRLTHLPFVRGPVEIQIGDEVAFFGRVCVLSGHVFDRPRLVLGHRCVLGHNVIIAVSRQIVLEDEVFVSSDCCISDNDGHPKDAELRVRNLPPAPKEILPVRICRRAWIGSGAYIMKGVTIGEGAIIGANSVVISNVPPYSLALGNPAEVILREVGRPRPAARGSQGGSGDSPPREPV